MLFKCWSRSCLKFILSWLHCRSLPILVPSQPGVFNLVYFNEIHQNVNDLVSRDKVEQSTSVQPFFDL